MGHVFKSEQLPSGKTIRRCFDDSGALVFEEHSYELPHIGIKFRISAGVKVSEAYFAKGRIVSRSTYEKARSAYADMPVADATFKDVGGWLLKAAAKERRQRSIEAKQHRPDPEKARKNDIFCSTVMDKGKREDAVEWIRIKKHTLGERNWSSSKRLVDRLLAVGCVHIYACEIDVYEGCGQGTGHLVVELPKEAEARGNILKVIDRLAAKVGYDGDFDDGQQYAYIKLD